MDGWAEWVTGSQLVAFSLYAILENYVKERGSSQVKTQPPAEETPAELKLLLWAPTRPCWADTEQRDLSLSHRNPKSGDGDSSGVSTST